MEAYVKSDIQNGVGTIEFYTTKVIQCQELN